MRTCDFTKFLMRRLRAFMPWVAGVSIGLSACGGGSESTSDPASEAAVRFKIGADAGLVVRDSDQHVRPDASSAAQAVPPTPLPPGTVTLQVVANELTFVRAYAYLSLPSCTYIENGTYTVLVAPTRGTLTFTVEDVTYNGGPCPGTYPSAVARYTWSDTGAAQGSEDFFALRFVTTSGSASADSNWLARLGSAAKARISFTNGADITGTTQAAVVGQRIAVSGSVQGLPAGASVQAHAWKATGTTTGGFVATRDSAAVVAADFARADATFHWIGPSSNTPSRQVLTYTATLSDNTVLSTNASFDLVGPDAAFIATVPGLVQRLPLGPIDILSFGQQQSFDQAGMQFSASGTPPASAPGQFMWVQLIRGMQMKVRGRLNHDCEVGAGLDNTYPYLDPYSEAPRQTSDSPAVLLTRSEAQVERDFAARMHLMWDPALPTGCSVARPPDQPSTCTSIPVPLGYVDWGFHAGAARDAGTQQWLVSGSGAAVPYVQSSGFPVWQAYIPGGGRLHLDCQKVGS